MEDRLHYPQSRSNCAVELMKPVMSLRVNPSHPGEVLQELYLVPPGLSALALARRIHVPRTRIGRVFGTAPEFRTNLQRAWDLARARETIDVSGVKPLAA